MRPLAYLALGAVSVALVLCALDLYVSAKALEQSQSALRECIDARREQVVTNAELRGRLATYREALGLARGERVGGP